MRRSPWMIIVKGHHECLLGGQRQDDKQSRKIHLNPVNPVRPNKAMTSSPSQVLPVQRTAVSRLASGAVQVQIYCFIRQEASGVQEQQHHGC